MFYTGSKMRKRKIGTATLFLLLAGFLFAQTGSGADDVLQRGSIPEELLRPRREEPLRYPVDMVIGPLGPGRASRETYEFARRVAAALLAGDTNAQILASVNRVFLEGYMAALNVVHPRSFRLGGGQNSPDGSTSFLVRFIGRDHGITGELFVRLEERQIAAPAPPPASPYESYYGEEEPPPAPPPAPVRVERVWVFDDLVLESPRSREEENRERQRFAPSIYHRLF